MKFASFDDRLHNWGRTVRSPRFRAAVCAEWARWAIALRRGTEEAPADLPPDDLDGWYCEAAWSALEDSPHKWALKYHYVQGMDPQALRSTLHRRHGVNMRLREIDGYLGNARRIHARELIVILRGRKEMDVAFGEIER